MKHLNIIEWAEEYYGVHLGLADKFLLYKYSNLNGEANFKKLLPQDRILLIQNFLCYFNYESNKAIENQIIQRKRDKKLIKCL